jgi:muramoyltetrapeptide carboxypeptidase
MTSRQRAAVQRPSPIPRPLVPGDLVGIVAPSGPAEAELLMKGIDYLERRGFRTLKGRYVEERRGYLAGTDRQRTDDLNSMLRNPDVRAVVFARGGYGIMRLLDSVDHAALALDPKILVGMSDLTALQLSLFARGGLVTFSGPMVAGQIADGLDELSEASLLGAMTCPIGGRDLLLEAAADSFHPRRADGKGRLRATRRGRACGPLLGGCLSLVAALLGTRHSPDYNSAVLLLEDVNEPVYRIDRMLTQLKLAGVLDRVGAILLGYFIGPDGDDLGMEVDRLVEELTMRTQVPVISGLPHGHRLPNLTLPHAAVVELDADALSMAAR